MPKRLHQQAAQEVGSYNPAGIGWKLIKAKLYFNSKGNKIKEQELYKAHFAQALGETFCETHGDLLLRTALNN